MASKKKYDANADIRKNGPQNYLLLQQANAARAGNPSPLAGMAARHYSSPLDITDNPYGPRQSGALKVSPEGEIQDYWGNSFFDNDRTTISQLENVLYDRAENEPWVLKALNGVTKAVGTAATTWLDGVAGLALGLTEGIYGAIADPNRNFFLAFNHGLYNNEISKGLREFSQWMEEALPNYKTKDEELNPYTLRNLTSVNTIFNDFLKVIGFSVGAYYSGGAWNKVLGLLTKAGTLSSTAAKTIGSVVSGVNEARIEAGNLYDEDVREQTGELMNAYLRASDELQLQIDALNEQPDTREKAIQLALLQQLQTELDSKYELEVNNIKDRAEKAALADMYMNAAYLPFQDAWAYGRLYRRASRMKNDLAHAVKDATQEVAEEAGEKGAKKAAKKKFIDLIAEKEASEKALGEAIDETEEGFKAKLVSRKKAALKGLAKAGGEYAEEVNQGLFSSFSSKYYEPDSPDAYYNALTDEDYKIKTNDFRTAMTHGIMDSWGNPASHVEGLMGFVNGLLGMPTFGRVLNSDENTYLGKGKPVGLSGGILGEMKYYARRNKEAQEAADIMNKTTKKLKDKSDDASNFITRMQAFSNAMDGFNDDDDKFEFKNASDNEMFNAIDAFARTGRLDHFKQLVKDGFGDPEQFTDEQLEDISRTAGKNEWLTTDGKPMVESEEGRQLMRKELKKQLQDTLNAIDRYEKSLERVRLISNNSLTNDLTAELAWLHWKLSLFEDRFKDIKSDNEELFNKMAEEMLRISDEYQGALDDTVSDDLLQEEKKRLEEELKRTDLTSEERKDLKDDLEATNAGIAARNEASSLKSILLFIKALKDAKTPLDLAAIIASNPSIMDYLNTTFNTTLDNEGVKMEKTKSWRDFYNQFEDKLGISFDDFSNIMDNLRDSAKLAIAARDFNKRFMEFSEDPIKLIENREKIDKKAAKENKAKTKAKGVDRLNNMEISEIAMGLRDGSIDLEEATKAIEDMNFESVEGGPLNAKEKLEEALKINDKYTDAIEKIEQLHQDGVIDDPTYNSAIQALEQSLSLAESVEELLDVNGEAFLDNDNIDTSDLENLPLDLLEEEIEKRRALVQTVINGISQDLIDAVEATQDMPNTLDIEDSVDLQDETVLNDTTGHDSIDKPKAENTREELRKNLEPLGSVTELTARQIATGAVLTVNTSPENEEGLINIVTDLGNIMDSLIKGGIENKKIAETIKDLQGYSMLKAIAGEELANAILNNYLVARKQNLDAISTAKQDTIELEKSNNKEDDVDPPTPDVTIDDIESQIELESQRDYSEGEVETSAPILNYWKPTITELPIHRDRGDNRPYWEIAKDLKKPNGSPRYTAAQLQRMKAVGEYMLEKLAFSRVNAGQVLSKNDGLNATEVHFITDRSLNEKAGEVVILMVDSKGNIIGDLMSKNDPAAQKLAGLIPFIEKCELILANDKTSNNYVTFKGSTTVLQNLIGKVMYTKKGETHTLNEIHGDLEFKLGIAVTEGTMPIIRTSGRAKKLGTTEEEDSIVTPLKSKNGLAFLIMPTSGAAKRGVARKYVTVPFHMPKYSEQTKDSALGRAIEDILRRISQGSNDEDAVKLKNELAELISVARSKNGYPEIHINYTGDTVKVTIKPVGADHLITLYNGNKNNENMVSNIQSKLYGTPFQINRKYINRDYKGLSYNRMIGELARTNIAVGETHTRSDWFTINPIGADGKQVTGSKIPSKKQNPGALKPASASGAPAGSIEVPYNGGSAYVDTNTWDVWYNGKNYGKATGPNVNKVRARAYGIKENLDMSKPYDTTWGYYNPVTDSFETKPKPEPLPKEDKIVDWIVSGETKFKINTNTWLVLNADGTEYNGPDINVYRAKVYGLIHELDMSKSYETPWGVFNPRDNTFDTNTNVILKDTENNTEEEDKKDTDKKEETPQKATKNTPEELREKAKANGLINTAVKKAVWEALTTELQQKLTDNIKMKQRQLMQGLVSAFNKSDNTFDKKALGGSVDLFLNKKALFSKVGQRNYGKKWDLAKELTKMEKMLPLFTKGELIKIQKGLIRIADSNNPGLAYGMFQLGVITISEVAAEGTLYHEAFHAVYHTLMSDAERQKIMDSAALLYGMDKTLLELEEALAEDFRKYVQFREALEAEMREKYANKSVLGRIMRFFKSLFNLCKKIRGKEPYMNKVFKDIYNGRYAKRKVQEFDAETRFKYEDFTPEMINIINKAPRDSQGRLLAPNGKPSNLTERQYVHVRTKAFKEWFGDWEKLAPSEKLTDEDKKHLSRFFKVLPEYSDIFNNDVVLLNQYLKSIFPNSKYRKFPFLHRSKLKINKFEIKEGRNLANAIWFTGRKNYGNRDAESNPYLTVALLNLENPIVYDDSGAKVNTPEKYKQNVTDLGYDSAIFEPTHSQGKNELDQIVVNDLNRIYILGTQEDLQKAKNFVNSSSKVVDENGEPLVVYHGTLGEFNTFDFDKLGKVTGQGYYTDHITGEKIPVDSSYAFFFTDNNNAARSYRNLAIWQQNEFRALVYRNLQAIFTGNNLIFTKLEGNQRQEQRDFINNIVSPYIGFDVLREANNIIQNKSKLTEEQKAQYAERFKQIANKIENLPDARSVSNHAYYLAEQKINLQYLIDNKDNIISNKSLDYFENGVLHISSGYGIREKGEVYLTISQQNGKYYAVGIPNTKGEVLITKDNIDDVINEYKKGVTQNENDLAKAEREGKYDSKGNILEVFLNIKNPLEHDYNKSSFPDSYLVSAKEGEPGAGYYGADNKLKKPLKIDGKIIPTGYVAARQVRKARQQGNDGVIYRNIRDPFTMASFGAFNPNQIKSATDNVGTYSKDNNDIRYSRVSITELQLEIDDANRLIQEIRRQMEIAKSRVSKGNWVREKGGNRYGILSNTGYFYESDAEDNIPDDIREAAEVKYYRGRYTIQYNPQLCISKIKFLTQLMYDLQALIELLKEYNDSFPEDRALSDMALRELQQREDMLDLIAEIRLYHSDKLMFSNLSKEDLDYILRRGISLEEYNMMSDLEKRVLLECKS